MTDKVPNLFVTNLFCSVCAQHTDSALLAVHSGKGILTFFPFIIFSTSFDYYLGSTYPCLTTIDMEPCSKTSVFKVFTGNICYYSQDLH